MNTSGLAHNQVVRNAEPERNLSGGRLLKRGILSSLSLYLPPSPLSPSPPLSLSLSLSFCFHFFKSFLGRHILNTKTCNSKPVDKDFFFWLTEYSSTNVSAGLQTFCKTHTASLIITQTHPLLWQEGEERFSNNTATQVCYETEGSYFVLNNNEPARYFAAIFLNINCNDIMTLLVYYERYRAYRMLISKRSLTL